MAQDGRQGRLDLNSDTWAHVVWFAKKRIEDLRESNDSAAKGDRETVLIRGQIKAWKEVISMPDVEIRTAKRKGILSDDDDLRFAGY